VLAVGVFEGALQNHWKLGVEGLQEIPPGLFSASDLMRTPAKKISQVTLRWRAGKTPDIHPECSQQGF